MKRRLLVLGFVLGLASPCLASDQVIMSSTSTALSATATQYLAVMGMGSAAPATAEGDRKELTASGGTLKNLRMEVATAPGAGTSRAFTLRKNGANTAVTCTISGTATSCTDTANSVAVVAADDVSVSSVPTSSPLTSVASWTLVFTSTTTAESLLMGGLGQGLDPATRWGPAVGLSKQNGNGAVRSLVSVSGTVKNLYVEQDEAPGDGKTATYTVNKNGTDSAITCQITGGTAITCSDTANSFTVVAGDWIAVKAAGVTAINGIPFWGLTFLADTAGEFVITASGTTNLDTASTVYRNVAAGDALQSTTESSADQLSQSMTIKRMDILLSGASGAGKSYQFTLMQDAVATGLDCTATNATTCTVSTNITIADDDLLDLRVIPSGTPTARTASVGFLGSISEVGAARRVFLVD